MTVPGSPHTEAQRRAGNWEVDIRYGGEEYSKTGKVGKNMKTGEPAAEYHKYDDDGHETGRVWMTASGEIQPD